MKKLIFLSMFVILMILCYGCIQQKENSNMKTIIVEPTYDVCTDNELPQEDGQSLPKELLIKNTFSVSKEDFYLICKTWDELHEKYEFEYIREVAPKPLCKLS